MDLRTKIGLFTLATLILLISISRLTIKKTPSNQSLDFFQKSFNFSDTFKFEFENEALKKIVADDLQNKEGTYAVYVESLQSEEKYGFNNKENFPAASLYKLILLAAVFKEIEAGDLTAETTVSNTKSHLSDVLGGVDFGYEDSPEEINYSVDEALTRVATISDNFAAIMLTEKLRALRVNRNTDNKLLVQIAQDLGMVNTSFDTDPIITTASDIAVYFKHLYKGEVVSSAASEQIIDLLSQSKINNRIPAKLPEGVKVAHKTGELARIRHDAGLVYLENNPYVIVLLSKDLKYEDDGVDTLAQLSKDIYDYFNSLKSVSKDITNP